jgi:hypothetical protein
MSESDLYVPTDMYSLTGTPFLDAKKLLGNTADVN